MKLDFSQGSSEIHPEQHSTCQQNGGKYRTSLYSSREYLPSKKIRYNPQSIQQMRQMTTEMTYDDSHLLRMVLQALYFQRHFVPVLEDLHNGAILDYKQNSTNKHCIQGISLIPFYFVSTFSSKTYAVHHSLEQPLESGE